MISKVQEDLRRDMSESKNIRGTESSADHAVLKKHEMGAESLVFFIFPDPDRCRLKKKTQTFTYTHHLVGRIKGRKDEMSP